MSREAMKQALEALEEINKLSIGENAICLPAEIDGAMDALRQALETEPLEYWNAVEGWVKIDEMREHFDVVGCGTIYKSAGEGRTPLYTAPPKREWVGLTDQEINSVCYKRDWTAPWTNTTFARAIEAKLREKNT